MEFHKTSFLNNTASTASLDHIFNLLHSLETIKTLRETSVHWRFRMKMTAFLTKKCLLLKTDRVKALMFTENTNKRTMLQFCLGSQKVT